ncbi:MAG: DUF1508 domain-containing protein [Bacteroidales bacterium]
MKREPIFEIARSSDKKYYWSLKASFGQVLLTSGIYSSKDKCIEGIVLSKDSIKNSNFLSKQTTNGEHYIVQISIDCQFLSRSEFYSTKESMNIGLTAIKKCIPIADIFEIL